MITENEKIELFDEFYLWLEQDGLKAKKSKRLHKKTIFSSLMANKKMTIENFIDFLERKQEYEKRDFIKRIEKLEGNTIYFKNSYNYISKIKINEELKEFQVFTIHFDCEKELNQIIKCRFEHLKDIEKLLKIENPE